MTFRFVDLFAGIGGFHAALHRLGGTCVLASEIDPQAAAVYERNWGRFLDLIPGRPIVEGDIASLTGSDETSVSLAQQEEVHVPPHDVLTAGFPCQPFSKSGRQRGMDEARGTLFYEILKVLAARRPPIVMLENVRNLAGPRHSHEWNVIIHSLRDLGYRVSDDPAVCSPHLLPPRLGGTPQVRERIFITGTYVGSDRAWAESDVEPPVALGPIDGWSPDKWDLDAHLLLPEEEVAPHFALSEDEVKIIDIWDDFVRRIRRAKPGMRLPGFPLWADHFLPEPLIPSDAPRWKADFLKKNSAFYRENRRTIDAWKASHAELDGLPASRRKLEWQAQDAGSLWDTVMHFRPSGIRAKRATYLPALVAITQTSIIGPRRRRITPREAARMQGLPDSFDFGDQSDAASYRQLGNAVCAGVASYVLQAHITRDLDDVPEHLKELALDVKPTAQLRLLTGS